VIGRVALAHLRQEEPPVQQDTPAAEVGAHVIGASLNGVAAPGAKIVWFYDRIVGRMPIG
jgi:hypothetical protein